MSTPEHEWPPLEEGYEDEFGPIDKEVYQAAGKIWPMAVTFGEFVLHDRDLATDILLKAVATVSKSVASGQKIDHPRAYLLITFKRLVVLERKRTAKAGEPLSKASSQAADDVVVDLERKILLREIFSHLNREERTLVLHSMMGYSHSEIARLLHLTPVTVRQRMHRLTERLRKTLETEDSGRP